MFGGFYVSIDGQAVEAFESQKVRALLAYLAAHRQEALSRDLLATLLWGEKSESAARQNLRQALHNLRGAFARTNGDVQVLQTTHQEVQIDPDLDCWVDLEEFEQALRVGLGEGGPDPHQLALAARLYAGDLLTGFYVKDSPTFEEWLVGEQERLREQAIECLRTLISSYLQRGEYRLGIQNARRLLSIDPASEEAHRYLMRLFALSGRRTRALAQFEELRSLLRAELGVEPLEETTALYQQILTEELPLKGGEDEQDPVGPIVPLVGRAEAYEQLHEEWAAVLGGHGRVTVIEGESGVGRSRLAKSFLNAVTAKRQAVVLRGHAHGTPAGPPFGALSGALRAALGDLGHEEGPGPLDGLAGPVAADLVRISPTAVDVSPGLAELAAGHNADPARLAASLAGFFCRLAWPAERSRSAMPVILIVEDLDLADPKSLEAVALLAAEIRDLPLWLITTARAGELGEIEAAAVEGGGEIGRVHLGRFSKSDTAEVAHALVGIAGASALTDFLDQWSEGLPLAVAELINYLWDRGLLVTRGGGYWTLRADEGPLPPPPADLEEMVHLRIQRLPTSARRLIAVAATAGLRFDAGLVQTADEEHAGVVEICLHLMLERWLIRHVPKTWYPEQRESDLAMWGRGARRGGFEFTHDLTRSAILANVNPLRKRILDGTVARALEAEHQAHPESVCERLAHHWQAAHEWRSALDALEISATRARDLGDPDAAERHYRRALEVLARVRKESRDPEADGLDARQQAIEQALD